MKTGGKQKNLYMLALMLLIAIVLARLLFEVFSIVPLIGWLFSVIGGVVALAGVLAAEPDLLLLDEPTAALDEAEKRRLVDVLRATPATLLVATHDRAFAAALCPREIVASRL